MHDLYHAIRALRRAPIFASVAIFTLALGIGANTAIFSIVNGVLLRPLTYPRSAQLMYLTTEWPPDAVGRPASAGEYLEFQQFNRSFKDVGAFRSGEANLLIADRARRVRSVLVDAHLLNTLALQPAQGRLFASQETDISNPPPVAVISYELWQSAYGERPVIGQRVDVDGRRYEVIGVMARGTNLMDQRAEIWLPLGFTQAERLARNNHNYFMIGRLKDDVTVASARAELNTLIESWAARTGITPGSDHSGHVFLPVGNGPDSHLLAMTPLQEQILGRAGRSIWMLQAAVGLLLLIACANVSSLLLARVEGRQREFAMLMALGAGRGRLLRKVMTESGILVLLGGGLGVFLGRAGVDALIRAYPDSLPRMGEVTVDSRVLFASIAVTVVCGLIFGLVPVIQTRPDQTAQVLKAVPTGSIGGARQYVRRGLVTAEIALAVIVVIGAGLLLRTVQNLTAVDTGFDHSRLVTFSITLPRTTYTLTGRVRTYQRLLEQLRVIAGVGEVSAMTGLPLDRPYVVNQTEIRNNMDTPGSAMTAIQYQRVMSRFFETMGISILEGRGFTSTDATSPGRVAVVNETLAAQYWRGRNPIGQQMRPGGDNSSPWFTVIGVAKDVKQSGVDTTVEAEAYTLLDQLATDNPDNSIAAAPATMNFLLRTTLSPATLEPTITRAVRDIDPGVPVTRLREMDDVLAESIRRPRLLATLVTLFSALALLLAAIGTYGVLTSFVTERRRELAIRLALGADRSQLLTQVMIHGLALAGTGLAVGLAGALGLTRYLTSQLFGVRPADTMTLAVVIAAMIGIAAIACWVPAWRASRVDPNVVLQSE